MISRDEAIPVIVGFADGLSDVGIDYLDKATHSESKPVLKKPSTIFNLGIGILGTVASVKFLSGTNRILGSAIFARHVGSGVGAIINAKLNKQPILEEAEAEQPSVEVFVEDITPSGEMELNKQEEETAPAPVSPTPSPTPVAEAISF